VNKQDICYASVVTLAQWIRQKTVSPSEVVQAFLDRIAQYNPVLNAYCTVAAEQALQAARDAEQTIMKGADLPPLLGVPVAIKDLVLTKGIRTTFGSQVFADNIPEHDSAIVSRLKEAGAIILGKTNTPEFGYTGITDNLLFGRTNNPWDLARTSGGSSGGSAVAVAAGLAPAAQGNDGGGSIRIPASCCGVYGLKPSFGRIPFDSARTSFSASVPFLHEGFITNSVQDASLLLTSTQGPHSHDPFSVPISRESYYPVERMDMSKVRVAYCPDLDFFPLDSEVKKAADRAVQTLARLGAQVELVSLGFTNYQAEVSNPFTGMWTANLGAHYSELLSTWETKMTKGLVVSIKAGQTMSSVEYKQLEKARSRAYRKVEAIFANYDLLVTPTLAVPAFAHAPGPTEIDGLPIDPYSGWMLTPLFNLTGHPAASINCGYSEQGLPIGLQLIGPRYQEDIILQISKRYQDAMPEHFLRPDLESRLG